MGIRSRRHGTGSADSSGEGVQRYYEEWWEDPRDIRNPIFNRLSEVARERIEECAGVRALDLGSGKGRVLSMLVARGLEVTAVEFSPILARELMKKFPHTTVVCSDVCAWEPNHGYDLVTCIELTQVISQQDLSSLLKRLRPYAKRILINVSNRQSLHGIWVRARRFQAPFIVTYTPADLLRILEESGYRAVFSSGVGFLTPISLLRDFQAPVISSRLANRFRKLDNCFPRFCHLYLVEAVPAPEAEG